MNIEIANRLVELRKKSGLSQEELATKLGLSRQAVSKWERAEASPDTDNLICLANLYGVSLDELLRTDEPVEDIINKQKERTMNSEEEKESEAKKEKKKDRVDIGPGHIHVSDEDCEVHICKHGIHIKDENGEFNIGGHEPYEVKVAKHKKRLVTSIVSGSLFLLSVIAYLMLGFFFKGTWAYGSNNAGWCTGWLVFLVVPVILSFIQAINSKKFCCFAYPILVTAVYLGLGLYLGSEGWHPWWVLFLTIPVFYCIFGPIDKYLSDKKKLKIEKSKIVDVEINEENKDE